MKTLAKKTGYVLSLMALFTFPLMNANAEKKLTKCKIRGGQLLSDGQVGYKVVHFEKPDPGKNVYHLYCKGSGLNICAIPIIEKLTNSNLENGTDQIDITSANILINYATNTIHSTNKNGIYYYKIQTPKGENRLYWISWLKTNESNEFEYEIIVNKEK